VVVVEAEVEAEGVEYAEAIKIRAPVISATGVGSVTISMAAVNGNSYFPNALEVAVVVAEGVTKGDAAVVAVGMVVAVAAVEDVAAVAAVGVYVDSTILPRAANLAKVAPNAMAKFSCGFILSIDKDGLEN